MRHVLFTIPIDDISQAQLEAQLISYLQSTTTKLIATPNAEMFVDTLGDKDFQSMLRSTDINLPDAVSLRFAISALTDHFLKHRHTGIDTLQKLVKLCEQEGKSILFFGANKNILERAIANLALTIKAHAIDPGALKLEKGLLDVEEKYIDQIHAKKPDIIAIALPHKKQLAFMKHHRQHFPTVKIMIGVGGAVDMIAGKFPRAPKWMRVIGMEWFWRVLLQPSRIGRIAKATIIFPLAVLKEVLLQRRLCKAIKKTVPEVFKQIIGQ